MKLTKKAKKGFTLVELIVVIAIIAILAAVSVAGYYGFIASANQSAADQEAAQVKNVIRAAATKGVDKKELTTVTTTYNWTVNGLEAGDEESTTEGSEVTYLADLVAIANSFGGLNLKGITLVDNKVPSTNKDAGLADVKVKGAASTADAKIIVSVTYVSAKNITSKIDFAK